MIITYTIFGKVDGFGSQYQAIMSGIAICAHMKWKYVHSPLINVAHLNGIDVKKLNTFIGIPITRHLYKHVNKIEECSGIVHRSVNPDIFYTNNVLNIIRNYYYSTPKPLKSKYDIAIHIRRGDVKENGDYEITRRYTSNDIYTKIINNLKIKYPNYTICIYSQGNDEDFINLNVDCIKLNNDLRIDFHEMVTSKVLIMAKSSYSYCAALLSIGEIYYMDFWHNKLNKWHSITELF